MAAASMRFCAMVTVCAVLLTSAVVSAQVAGERRWCTISTAETATCRTLMADFQANDPGNNTWSCVQKADAAGCRTALQNREVDYYVMSPANLYASIPLGAKVVGFEEYPVGAAAYYSVAIVKKADCDKNPALTINDYKGKASCHTGYDRTAGWNMPIGHFVSTGVIKPVNRDAGVKNDIESVQNFFGKTCAPGNPGSPRICTLCPEGNCVASNASNYYDYEGVLYCVEKGGGDIGFTKHDVLGSFAAGQPKAKAWAERPVGDFRILCPNGGCTTFNDYKRCNTVIVPARAIVTYAEATPAAITAFQATLDAVNSDPTFVDAVFRGRNTANHVFQSDTIRLNPYTGTAREYMGGAFAAYQSMAALEANTPLATGGAVAVTSGFAILVSAVAAALAIF